MDNLESTLRNIVSHALEAAALVAVDAIVEVTPRDKKRLPKNINRKDGKRPKRKKGVVSILGNYYPAVTGNLKKSIGYERYRDFGILVGSERNGHAAKYAKTQEFWLPKKNVPPRPYVSRPYHDVVVQKRMLKEAQNAISLYLSR